MDTSVDLAAQVFLWIMLETKNSSKILRQSQFLQEQCLCHTTWPKTVTWVLRPCIQAAERSCLTVQNPNRLPAIPGGQLLRAATLSIFNTPSSWSADLLFNV